MVRVELTTNLERYRAGLVKGSRGTVIAKGKYGYVVKYDCGHELDTLVKSLKLVYKKEIS